MKIAALVSGGVDSSVSLALLKEAGHDVTAFYLKIWLEDEVRHLGDCAWEEDLEFVEKTCKKLNVPFEVISLQREYWNTVVSETISEVRYGRTPNPDIWCNEKIKFGSFYKKIPDEFEKVATGHYAQVEESNGKYYLKQAPDPVKDQTYFLSRLDQQQLSRAMFPIGHLPKQEVRNLAQKFGLPTAHRKDSQGICFLGKFKFSEFLQEHLGGKTGKIIEHETGKILGEHNGFWFYTKGQRQGLGLSGGPWYVKGKDAQTNEVFVSQNAPIMSGNKHFSITDCNWIPIPPDDGKYLIKLRHGEVFHLGTLQKTTEKSAIITLKNPDRGIAEGQSAVLYFKKYCLGGGIINDG
jgi:tRNA (5-methylaminomethyl-2-thiouridylate)-methyltransferase